MSKFKHVLIFAVVAFAAVLFLVGCGTTTTPANSEELKNPTAKIGGTVSTQDWEYKLESVEDKDQIDQPYLEAKKPQGVFKIIKVTVKNLTNQTKQLDSSNFEIRDSQDRKYQYSIEGQTAWGTKIGDIQGFFLRQIQPGLTLTGDIVFDVPKDAGKLRLIVSDGMIIKGVQKAFWLEK